MCAMQLNRRSFLLAGGLTALASTRVLGTNDTLRVGVIGAGSRMGDLLNAADKVGNYQIVAVSDVYGPRRDAIKQRSNGVATTHVNYHEVLEQQLDAVLIAFLTTGMCVWPSTLSPRAKTSIWKSQSLTPWRKPRPSPMRSAPAANPAMSHAAAQLEPLSRCHGSHPGR